MTSLFYLPLTICYLDLVVRFFWKCCVSNITRKIFNFIKKKKKCFNLLHLSWKKLTFSSGLWLTLPLTVEWSYFSLHFSSSSTKKLHHRYNQQIYIYIWDSFSSFSLLCFLIFSLCLIKWFDKCSMDFQVQEFFNLVISQIPREWPHVWLKSRTLQKQKLILVTIFFSVSHVLLDVLLFFFIIYFYLIDITYKYNKLLLIDKLF